MLTEKEFEMLWRNQFRRVYNFFYYTLLNHAEADDLTSITFLELYRSLNSYDTEKSVPEAYLMGIAKNVLKDHYSENKRISYISFESEDFTEPSVDGFEDLTSDKILLKQILDELNARERQVLYYRYFLGLSYAEIAEQLEITITNATTLHSRTISKAKKIYEKISKKM